MVYILFTCPNFVNLDFVMVVKIHPGYRTVRKIVVPIAGLGTRLMPTTRALPKEMLPLGKYPAIQLVVEELVSAKLEKFLLITSCRKTLSKTSSTATWIWQCTPSRMANCRIWEISITAIVA